MLEKKMKKLWLCFILCSLSVQLMAGQTKRSSVRKTVEIPWCIEIPYVTTPCSVEEIDSQTFYSQWRLFKTIEHVVPTAKRKGRKLQIESQCRTFVFRSDLSDAGYQEFYPWGQYGQWAFVHGYTYNEQRYYMINLTTDSLTILLGEPRIYDDKVLCLEGDYADSPQRMSLFQIHAGGLELLFCKSLRGLGIWGAEDWIYANGRILIKCCRSVDGRDVYSYYRITPGDLHGRQ